MAVDLVAVAPESLTLRVAGAAARGVGAVAGVAAAAARVLTLQIRTIVSCGGCLFPLLPAVGRGCVCCQCRLCLGYETVPVCNLNFCSLNFSCSILQGDSGKLNLLDERCVQCGSFFVGFGVRCGSCCLSGGVQFVNAILAANRCCSRLCCLVSLSCSHLCAALAAGAPVAGGRCSDVACCVAASAVATLFTTSASEYHQRWDSPLSGRACNSRARITLPVRFGSCSNALPLCL